MNGAEFSTSFFVLLFRRVFCLFVCFEPPFLVLGGVSPLSGDAEYSFLLLPALSQPPEFFHLLALVFDLCVGSSPQMSSVLGYFGISEWGSRWLNLPFG